MSLLDVETGESTSCDDCVLPTTAVIDRGGACAWVSDYWLLKVPEQVVFAHRYQSVVTPSGRVSVTSWYAAEPLTEQDCFPTDG